jgi:hypothetical protein
MERPDLGANIVRVNKYEIGQTLGEGTYGKYDFACVLISFCVELKKL